MTGQTNIATGCLGDDSAGKENFGAALFEGGQNPRSAYLISGLVGPFDTTSGR
jgi:hypothetical protein